MDPARHRAFIFIVLSSLLLSSCGGSLWGSYSEYLTPTPSGAVPSLPSNTPVPTAADTSTPTLAPSSTPTPTLAPIFTSTFTQVSQSTVPTLPTGGASAYISQSGDSLDVIARHFAVSPSEIISSSPLPETGFINPGTLMFIPNRFEGVQLSPADKVIPDSELVDSPSAVGFDIAAYVAAAEGRLSAYHEYMTNVGTITGAQGVERISLGSSISPRLLLALIQYHTGWVQGAPKVPETEKFVLGYSNPSYPGLYQQMRLMVGDLLTGYYSWRAGVLDTLTFPDGASLRLAPSLNAGSVAIMYMFSRHLNYADWLAVMDPQSGFLALFKSMFGDPFARADELGPLFPSDLNQPPFILPFEVGVQWTFTGGPHPAWEQETALAALDFAPPAVTQGCFNSTAWVVAIAPGWIVRSETGYVVLDMDGDGFEQTGWVVLYQHIATKDRIAVGTRVAAGDHIGHPSCEGGTASGTHVHITRKYNGEWVAAGGPLPFVMSGWTAHAGAAPYKGTLTKGDQTVVANVNSIRQSAIIRKQDE